MNNSKITLDNLEENQEVDLSNLQKQQGELSQIIEAINRIESSEDWQKLKTLYLNGVLINLERQLIYETSRKEINPSEIYRLQGQLAWARKYADLKKLSEVFKQQLEGIKLRQKTWNQDKRQ